MPDTDDRRGLAAPEREGAAGQLRALGVGAAEEAAYELLLVHPAAELAAFWDRPEDLGATLAALERQGLAAREPGPVPRYRPAPPAIALGRLVAEREQRLREAREHLAELTDRYHRRQIAAPDPEVVVEVVTGRDAVLQRTAQVQWRAREQIRCLDDAPRARGALADDLRLLGLGIDLRAIYGSSAMERADALSEVERLAAAGQRVRVLPAVPMRLYLVDREVAVVPLHGAARAAGHRDDAGAGLDAVVIVHPSMLLDALSGLFESLWDRALPLPLTLGEPAQAARMAQAAQMSGAAETAAAGAAGAATTAAAPDTAASEDGRLLSLLLAGLTDKASARQLGVSQRTVQRRVAALLDSLGARTRFQAGARFALHGLDPGTPPPSAPPGTAPGP
ncbi:hypothetical protein AB0399_12895 [Streptomyces sp. NPDC088194]|uniref:hypothetical protein n=1 Tax=Streptomyces sp. NPDC088194 TaxID=3154931 RepID=UPI00344BFD89